MCTGVLELIEVAEGITVEEIKTKADAEFTVADKLR